MNEQKFLSLSLIIISIICIFPYIYLCQFCHPVNDDYSFALSHIDTDCFQSVIDSYNNWSGRFFATFVSSSNPLSIYEKPVVLYKIYSVIIVILFWIIPFISLRILLKNKLTNLNITALSCLFFITFMTLCPKVSELFYWFSSYTAFTIPPILSILFFSILIKENNIYTFIQFLLAFIIPGGNEVTAILFVSSLLFLSFITRKKRIIVLTTVAFLSIFIVILSPGNSIRMSYQLSQTPYLWSFIISIGQTLSWGYFWLPTLILATFLYIPIGIKLQKIDCLHKIKISHYLFFVISSILLAHIPPTLGLSSVVIGRTANALLFYFIIYYFIGIQILINNTNIFKYEIFYKKKFIYSLGFCFTFLCLFSIESPTTTAYIDILSKKAEQYNNIWTQRDSLAQNNKDKICTIAFEPLGITSKSLYSKDLETNTDGEFCKAYEEYNNLKCKVFVKDNNIQFMNNYETLFYFAKSKR